MADASFRQKLVDYLLHGSIPAKMIGSAYSGLTFPGDVMAGDASPYDTARSMDLAGLATFGSMAAPASPNELRMGMYYRRTQGDHPDNGAGYMMFADDPYKVDNYGDNLWSFNSDDLPTSAVMDTSSPEFRRGAYRALRSEGIDPQGARALTDEAAPSDIVNTAGMWDDPGSVETVWNRLLDTKGIRAVTTPDGAIVFDPQYIKAVLDGNGA